MQARVKICGVRTVADAMACVEAGADAIGVNFIETSPRRVEGARAREIVDAVGGRSLVVGLVAGMRLDAMRALRDETGVGCLQLHGDVDGAALSALLPHAYGAVPVATADDVARADALPGDYVMVDAKVAGALGGTGKVFDWSLVVELAKRRRLVLAGGLTPANVASAVAQVHPWCVDVASGVESAPGVKDMTKVRTFIEEARKGG
jgi:phosphoribosylanthranilate isomerase